MELTTRLTHRLQQIYRLLSEYANVFGINFAASLAGLYAVESLTPLWRIDSPGWMTASCSHKKNYLYFLKSDSAIAKATFFEASDMETSLGKCQGQWTNEDWHLECWVWLNGWWKWNEKGQELGLTKFAAVVSIAASNENVGYAGVANTGCLQPSWQSWCSPL